MNDAIHFVKMFSKPISTSACHTYISALPFAPASSRICKNYQASCGCTVEVLTGALQEWPQYIWQSGGHKGTVWSVGFSPDGKQIVSGSGDATICLWDAASGQLVGSPLKGHSRSVTSVAFSPDGNQIVLHYANGAVRIWNPATGQLDACQELSGTKLISLTIEDGWVCDARDKSLLYCIPEHHLSTRSWAFSGAKLVMGNRLGKVTIIDATRVFESRGISI